MHHILILLILTGVAFCAGIIDTLAGGGGLLTVPALLSAGIPPVIVLGTNRLQSIFGELTASIHFFRKKKLNVKGLLFGFLMTAIGSVLGSVVAQLIHPENLKKIIPILLVIVLIYTILSPAAKDIKPKQILSDVVFFIIFGLIIGFYNGFFGPPTGTFWMFSLMCFLGLDIVRATMHAKPLNSIGNIASLIVFMIGGKVYYSVGLCMGAGQICGARIGAHLVIHKGHKLIKPLFITVVSIMLIDILIKTYL
jgi:uncharacterized protein